MVIHFQDYETQKNANRNQYGKSSGKRNASTGKRSIPYASRTGFHSAAVRENCTKTEREKKAKTIAIVMLSIIITLFIILVDLTFTAKAANAENAVSGSGIKCYKSICIESGDSLWSIADREMGAGWSDERDYIAEVKEINGLRSDKILAGDYICLPYYQ